MDSTASAVWRGGLKDGKGELTAASGTLSGTPYSFQTRFEGASGTNPEELIAASHAGCYAMALSMILGNAGLAAERIDAQAKVSLKQQDGGFAITNSHLTVRAKIPGATPEAFAEAANAAKVGCPVSKVLNAEITLDAQLVS